MRTKLAIGLVAVLAALLLAPGASPRSAASTGPEAGTGATCRIGWSFGNTTAAIYNNILQFVKQEARIRGCKLLTGNEAGDPVKQFNTVQNWVNSRSVDAIVILPLAEQLNPVVKQARAAGIRVVAYNTVVPGAEVSLFFDNVRSGRQLAFAAIQWAKKNFPGAKLNDFQWAIYTFDQCGKSCTDRTDTIKRRFQFELKKAPAAEGDAVAEESGLEQAESILQANPGLDMLLGINDGGALGAYKAFQQAGKTKSVFIGGMDGQREALQLVARGTFYRATSALRLSDIGRAIIDIPADILETGRVAQRQVVISPVLIDSPGKARAFIQAEYG